LSVARAAASVLTTAPRSCWVFDMPKILLE
jgi:hypothetical protein